MKNLINIKIIVTILLAIVLITNILQILPFVKSMATNKNIGDQIFLESAGTVEYHLKSHGVQSGGYVITSLAGYYDNGSFYPAYCLNRELHGVDDNEGYNVTLTDLMENEETYNKIWRVAVAGYPYNTPESLGVSDWTYAYQATKMAVYCVTGQANLDDYYATDSIGQSIVDLIHRLVAAGNDESVSYRTPLAQIEENGAITLNGDYYIQNYNVSSNLDLSKYTIAITNFPEGTIATDSNGNTKETFNAGESFQVKIPKAQFEKQEINGTIRATIETKDYAIFYANSFNDATQDYALTTDPISLNSCSKDLKIKNNNSKIKLYKYNEDKTVPIAGVTFELLNENNAIIATTETNSQGIATFENLYAGKYYVREKSTAKGYLLDNSKMEFEVGYNETAERKITNSKPTGTLILNKKVLAKQNIDTSLIDMNSLNKIKFKLTAKEDIKEPANGNIIYKKGQEIKTYNLNKAGTLKIEKLPIGTYELQEVETLDGLVLNNTKYEVKFTQKDTTTKIYTETKEIKNETTVFEFSKTDITGDKELEGAKLTVLDENEKIIDTWISNDKSHKIEGLVVGKTYTLREEIAPNGYAKATDIKFQVKNTKEVQKVQMKDELILKNIKVLKADSSSKERIYGKFTFGLYKDINCTELIQQMDSNEDEASVTFEDLIYGTYYIKEVNAPEGYQLSEKIVEIKINDDGVFADGNLLEENDETYSFMFYDDIIPAIQTGNIISNGFLVVVAILSIVGIISGIIIFKKKN